MSGMYGLRLPLNVPFWSGVLISRLRRLAVLPVVASLATIAVLVPPASALEPPPLPTDTPPALPSSPPGAGTFDGTFSDDDGLVQEPDIETIAAFGITQGCSQTFLYCPADFVPRAQMASFFVRALDLPTTNVDWFTDDDDSIHEDAINRVAAAGIALGCDVGRYCPSNLVSREQMATFLVRAFQVAPSTTRNGTAFRDVAGPHAQSINGLANAGIAQGCTADMFCPATNVNRAQMASFLARALRATGVEAAEFESAATFTNYGTHTCAACNANPVVYGPGLTNVTGTVWWIPLYYWVNDFGQHVTYWGDYAYAFPGSPWRVPSTGYGPADAQNVYYDKQQNGQLYVRNYVYDEATGQWSGAW